MAQTTTALNYVAVTQLCTVVCLFYTQMFASSGSGGQITASNIYLLYVYRTCIFAYRVGQCP